MFLHWVSLVDEFTLNPLFKKNVRSVVLRGLGVCESNQKR